MSLDVALQNALSGLQATQAQLQVVSNNISNVQTVGYSEETLTQNAQTTPAGGSGVLTGVIQRVSDQALSSNLLGQTTASNAASTRSTYYQQIEALLGQVNSKATLSDTFNTFTSAMNTLAATPEDATAQSSAVAAGQALAQQLNSLSSGIQGIRESVDGQLGTDVTTLNTSLQKIASLNSQITALKVTGESTATLEDARDQALTQVAQLMGVKSYIASDGTMTVMTTSGQNLVSGIAAETVGYAASGTVSATTSLSALTVNGVDITSNTTTGEMGALLTLRDTDLPGLTAQLNQFTNNLYNSESTPNLQTTASSTGATDANHFFSGVNTTSGVDNAATITVNPSLIKNPTILDQGTTGADPSISTTLSSNLTNSITFKAAGNITNSASTTLSAYSAQIISVAANTAATASSDATYQSSLATQLSTQLSAVTGVNLDTELSRLTVYQNAYSASAKVITTLQTLYQTLMQM